ncbi:MAG: glutamate--tRNA ligase [Chloroflexota bacterium]|nr:glutamate--tRNA ligase [Chloroflexota bacterium]
MDRARVRYAPSPTGKQHIGGMRTALFNYLYARKSGGDMILRIEDTDVSRSEVRYEKDLYTSLRWLGLEWDEGPNVGGDAGPYRQSERLELYRHAVRRLLDAGKAYFCYCTPEELAAERERAAAEGRPPRYSGRCRDPQVRQALSREEGRSPVVRFWVPHGETVTVRDLVRGKVRFSSDDIGDFIIYRSQDESLEGGRPLYNLAAVVDDHAMKISHVLRGEEHLPNTPRQMLLYEAFGYEPPRFGHLSLIMTPDGTKMSKRFGDISIASYRERGYLPEAVVAYLATLGWAPGKHPERFTLHELAERFDLDQLSDNPSIFDPDRLEWFNKRRLQRAETDYVGKRLKPRLQAAYGRWHRAAGTSHDPQTWYRLLVEATQEEATTLQDMVSLSEFAFVECVSDFAPEAQRALARKEAPIVLKYCLETLTASDLIDHDAANDYLRRLREHFREEADLGGRDVMFPLRAALTGSVSGPSLGLVMSLCGPSRCQKRLEKALSLGGAGPS